MIAICGAIIDDLFVLFDSKSSASMGALSFFVKICLTVFEAR